MRMCLRCRAVLPCGDNGEPAAYCTTCRRALGRRCPKGHASPWLSKSQTCAICDEGPVDGVPYLSLSWLPQLVAIFAMVSAWRWTCHHPWQAARIAWSVGTWALAVLFDAPQSGVMSFIRAIAAWWVLLWIFTLLIPQVRGRPVRAWMSRTAVRTGKTGVLVSRLAWKLVARRSRKDAKKPAQPGQAGGTGSGSPHP